MRVKKASSWLLLLALFLSSCNFPLLGFGSPTPAKPTDTPSPPTSTPIPLAFRVNGAGFSLLYFEAEVERFESAQRRAGIDLATLPGYRAEVLEALIDLKLLALGATQNGFEVTSEQLDAQIDEIITAQGTQEAFETWLLENIYNVESFRSALTEELLAAQMVTLIGDSVPLNTEQVHARHILLATQEEAEDVRAQIMDGEDFGELAQIYSIDASTRPASGDLGWFPRGYLLWDEIEDAAFTLAPGEMSPVIQSDLGYHLVETLERGEHQLDFQARLFLQEQAVQDWLTERRRTADIQVYITP